MSPVGIVCVHSQPACLHSNMKSAVNTEYTRIFQTTSSILLLWSYILELCVSSYKWLLLVFWARHQRNLIFPIGGCSACSAVGVMAMVEKDLKMKFLQASGALTSIDVQLSVTGQLDIYVNVHCSVPGTRLPAAVRSLAADMNANCIGINANCPVN